MNETMIDTIIDSNTCHRLNNMPHALAILLFVLPCLAFAHMGYSTRSYCLDGIERTTFSLECPSPQLIKLGRIIYGYSWSNDCSYIDKDCTMDVPREDIRCSSTSNCTVHVVEHPLILQDCWNLAASYVQAEYECITDYSIQNICQSQDLRQSHGFLSTPTYPNGFPSNLNCPCSLIASAGHSIVLEIIDFHLPTCAEAGLILWFGQDFQTKCLTHNPVILISNIDQNVTLRFYSLKNVQAGGFLLKYAVSPESNNATVRLQCFATTTPTQAFVSNSASPTKSFTLPLSTSQSVVDQGSLISNPNDLLRRLRPVLSTGGIQQDVSSFNKQPQVQVYNQSTYKKYLLPDASSPPRLNMTLIIIFIIAVIVFLIVINVLIWFMCASHSKNSKSTSSLQNLYSQTANVPRETTHPSNRLKTLHSLLYTNHKTLNADLATSHCPRELDSPSTTYSIPRDPPAANLDHGFIIKSKSNHSMDQPRQINSWDDI